MTRTRIIVADAMTAFRAAVRNVLEREKDFEVAEAATLPALLAALEQRRFDVVLIDLALPPDGGIDAVRAVAERFGGPTEVIVWSDDPCRESVFAAVRAGATGFLHKEISAEGLVRSLRGIARGEAPLSRELMSLVIGALHDLEAGNDARERTAALSGREREVLGHVARGERNKQIAARLAISEFTVKRHVQNILRKLELSSRREAAAFYRTAVTFDEEPAGP